MKRFSFIFLFLFVASTLWGQQAKRIYITLDVSGSMGGDKYTLANYTTQMLVTLCDEDDEVHMIVDGADKILSREKDPLTVIQKPFGDLHFGESRFSGSQFDDIRSFNSLYRPSSNKQDWLYIVGDGEWATFNSQYDDCRSDFQRIVEGGTLNVCYLQTGREIREDNDFTQFANSLGVIDIGKSSVDPKTIINECNRFTRKILGFSDTPLKIERPNRTSVNIKSELPLSGFYLVYQDDVKPEALPKIQSVTADGKSLQCTLKGTPSTIPLRNVSSMVELSGNVWFVKVDEAIPANSGIDVSFDKAVDPSNIRVYPLVKDIEFGTMGISRIGKQLRRLDGKTFVICREESKARVRIELSDGSQGNLPESLLKDTKVVVKANGQDYPAHYKNGGFECEIDLVEEETQYYAECDSPGYFKRVTPITKIVKGDCPEEKDDLPETVAPVSDLGSFTFKEIQGGPISFTLHDEESLELLDPNQFDISFEIENSFLFEKPEMHVEDGSVIVLDLHPKGEWCECLFPETLNLKMKSSPRDSAFDEYGKNYEKRSFPIIIHVQKERPWLSRCLWVLIAILTLILLFIYIRALTHKRRFKKSAQINPIYINNYGEEVDDGAGQKLRKSGFPAWFARWFIPGTEKSQLTFSDPSCTLTFFASDSGEVIKHGSRRL